MMHDIAQYRKAIEKCVDKLDSIRLRSNNDAFLDELSDIRRTIRMTIEYDAGYQGAPCNSLDWIENNPMYYGCNDSTDGTCMIPDGQDDTVQQSGDDYKPMTDFDVDGWNIIFVSNDGSSIQHRKMEEDDAFMFWNNKHGVYNEIADCTGIYAIRYQGGPREYDKAKERLLEYIAYVYEEHEIAIEKMMKKFKKLLR